MRQINKIAACKTYSTWTNHNVRFRYRSDIQAASRHVRLDQLQLWVHLSRTTAERRTHCWTLGDASDHLLTLMFAFKNVAKKKTEQFTLRYKILNEFRIPGNVNEKSNKNKIPVLLIFYINKLLNKSGRYYCKNYIRIVLSCLLWNAIVSFCVYL